MPKQSVHRLSKGAVWLFAIILTLAACWVLPPAQASAQTSKAVQVSVQDVIGPATADHIIRHLEQAIEDDADLFIIELDTPGGLDSSMRAIIRSILGSPIPVATFVSPAGARAASAGTFILYASHIAAMVPASNLGAASPVAIGANRLDTDGHSEDSSAEQGDEAGDNDQDKPRSQSDVLASKATSDAAAYLRSLAQLRGRDADFAEKAVREASSLSASEALEQGVIDYVASSVSGLLKQLDGAEIRMSESETITLSTASMTVENIETSLRTQLLSVLTNPQLAVILMMIGVYGLFFELTSPGFALPGVAGVICLLLAMYAFHMLPINWAGVALLLVGVTLMIAEAFVPSFGALGVGGLIAFVLGGTFLTDSDTDLPGFDLSLPFMAGVGGASLALILLAGSLAARVYRRPVVTGESAMVGQSGVVTGHINGQTYARVAGEQWHVVATQPLSPGQVVRVTGIDGLTLTVETTQEIPK